MKRAALSEGHLELARKAWVALFGRQRHNEKSRARLLAAEKLMNRADEALSRALSDLREAVPPTPPPLSAKEAKLARARAAMARMRAPVQPSKPGELVRVGTPQALGGPAGRQGADDSAGGLPRG